MRDIPLFTTEFGVASLVLKEIPYTQSAYIHIRSSLDTGALIKECVGFCRAAGAERIYATGEGMPLQYSLYTEVFEMQISKESLPKSKASIQSVEEDNLELWRSCYNDRMKNVPNAAWMDKQAAKKMLDEKSGYFVLADTQIIGIGIVREDTLAALASMQKGCGREVVLALSQVIRGDVVRLEVAAGNQPAMRLYQSMGFEKKSVKSTWYKIL